MADEPVYKCSLLMSKGKSGWSDTMWVSKSFSTSATDAMTKMLGYVVARNGFTDPGVTFESIRVADSENPQNVLIRTLGVADDAAATTNDMVNTAILVTQKSAFGRRKMYLRGIKDSATFPGRPDQLSPDIRTAINTWANYCKAQDFCTYTIQQTNSPKKSINNVTVEGGLVKVTTDAVHTFLTGDKVYIGKLASSPVLNGYWKVTVLDNRNFTLNGSNTTLASIIYLPGAAYVRKPEKVASIITSTDINRLVTRRAGRPTGLSTGARRKKLPRLPIRLAVS